MVVASHNNIRSIVSASSTQLQVLDLRNNRDLSKLPDRFFVDLKRLWQLEVANTSIDESSLLELTDWSAFEARSHKKGDKRHSSLNLYELQ
jgi:hypothetical protein